MSSSDPNTKNEAYEGSPDQSQGSPTPPNTNKNYKRNYRACLNCRVRKVKCDLGPVDNPREGKCARCLRERKDCVFVDSKRGGNTNIINGKRKRRRSSVETVGNDQEEGEFDHIQRKNSLNSLNSSNLSMKLEIPPKLPSVTTILQNPESGFNEYNSTSSSAYDLGQTHTNSSQNYYNTLPVATNLNLPKQQQNQPPPQIDDKGSPTHFSTMEGALVFLAKAAGTIAKADERDNIDGRKQHEQIEAGYQNSNNNSNRLNESINQTPNANNLDTILNSNHTSDFSNTPIDSKPINRKKTPLDVPPYIKHNGGRMSIPAFENASSVRPRASTKLSNIDYIGGSNGILSEQEAEMLINFFYSTMYPFFPYLPKFLETPKVLANYPILLCAILTIASRYHPFENNVGSTGEGGVPRNIEVHDRLWLYVQRLISQTVWAEASTRSLGTVFAFLLFTEWNPRAIHWRWSDYANKAEESSDDGYNFKTGSQDSGSGSENLAGLGAMRRSYRMAWMLIGSAVRLAQDMGFMEVSQKTFLATHIAEINSVMNISRRSMLAHSLAEVELDEEEISPEELEYHEVDDRILKMTEEELKQISGENILKFTASQKAQIELLQIMSVGHEALYGYKAQLGSLSQRQNLTILNIFSPLINNWGRKYQHFLVPSNYKTSRTFTNLDAIWLNPKSKVVKEISSCIEHESFIFEFNYLKLYIYSLALSPSPPMKADRKGKRKISLKLDEISRSAKYIEQAFNAANEMLSVAHRVHKLRMLRFMPVRWLTRMVRAVAFIVKCYLTITAHKKSSKSTLNNSSDIDSTILSLSLISVDDIIQSIQKAAITLRDCSPDELHLCTRYSNVLMYLCSEMKTNSKSFVNDEKNGDSNDLAPIHEREDNSDIHTFNMPTNKVFDYNYFEGMNPGNSNTALNPATQSKSTSGNNLSTNGSNTNNSSNINTPPQSLVGDSEVMEFFMNDRNIGLDFVGPWTEMIEQQLNLNDFNFEDSLLQPKGHQ